MTDYTSTEWKDNHKHGNYKGKGWFLLLLFVIGLLLAAVENQDRGR